MTGPAPEEYHRAYVAVQRPTDAAILKMLRDAYKDVNRQLGRMARERGPGSSIRRDQLLAIKRSILENQADVFRRLGKIVEVRRVEAAAAAIRVAGRYDEAVFALGDREEDARALTEGLETTETRAVDVAVARMTGTSTPLSRRVYRAEAWSNGRLEARINSALARGLSADEFAREIREFVDPRTPGGTRYAALRLARTELNNAFHAISIREAQLKPWIEGMEWHLSGSHPSGHKDECDRLSGKVFKPEDVPAKPHPQCLCFVTPKIQDDDDAFLDDLVSGLFDDFVDERATSPVAHPEPIRPGILVQAHRDVPREPANAVEIARAVNDYAFGPSGGALALDLNAALRGKRNLTKEMEDLRDELDRAFEAIPPLPRMRHVMRMVSGDPVFRDRIVSIAQSGGEWTDEGFMSTTSDEDILEDFNVAGDAVEFDISIPRGGKALEVGKYLSDEPGFFDQSEFLLPRGTTLRLERPRRTPDGRVKITATVVLREEDKPKPAKVAKANRYAAAKKPLEPLPAGTQMVDALKLRFSQKVAKARVIQEVMAEFGKDKEFATRLVNSYWEKLSK